MESWGLLLIGGLAIFALSCYSILNEYSAQHTEAGGWPVKFALGLRIYLMWAWVSVMVVMLVLQIHALSSTPFITADRFEANLFNLILLLPMLPWALAMIGPGFLAGLAALVVVHLWSRGGRGNVRTAARTSPRPRSRRVAGLWMIATLAVVVLLMQWIPALTMLLESDPAKHTPDGYAALCYLLAQGAALPMAAWQVCRRSDLCDPASSITGEAVRMTLRLSLRVWLIAMAIFVLSQVIWAMAWLAGIHVMGADAETNAWDVLLLMIGNPVLVAIMLVFALVGLFPSLWFLCERYLRQGDVLTPVGGTQA